MIQPYDNEQMTQNQAIAYNKMQKKKKKKKMQCVKCICQ